MIVHRTLGVVSLLALLTASGCTATPATTIRSTTGHAQPASTLAHRDPIIRSQMREQALDRLVRAASSPMPQERANALEGLLEAPTRLSPIAAIALTDENEGVRAIAAVVSGRANLRELAPAIRVLQSDTSPFVRASAIYALDALGVKVDPSQLGAMLFDAESTQVRAHAAYLLGEMKDDAALPMLADAARKRSPTSTVIEQKLLELQIAEAMVKLGERHQIDSIRAALLPSSADDLEATALAVQIIGSVNDRASIDRLIYLSAYKDARGAQMPAEVLLGVASSLGKLGERGGSWLADRYANDSNPLLRAQAASVYGDIGRPENLGKLGVFMDDPSPLVQISGAIATLQILGG